MGDDTDVIALEPLIEQVLKDTLGLGHLLKETYICLSHNSCSYVPRLLSPPFGFTRSTVASSRRSTRRWGLWVSTRRLVTRTSSFSRSRFSTTRTSSNKG